MSPMKLMAALVAVTMVAVPALADWIPGDPYKMHFPQLPDLAPTGLDVLATTHNGSPPPPLKVLADDWLCTASGPVADIHLWGSWLNDHVPNMDPAQVWFRLSIHENVAADHVGFSQPGAELWSREYVPYAMTVVPWAKAPESFYDPNSGQLIGTDTQVWQYNFFVPVAEAFRQEAGTVYWLVVQAALLDGDQESLFGWKTSLDHFADDAVFGHADILGQPYGDWQPLTYPVGHPLEGQSIDLAFVITIPEPATLVLLTLGGLLVLRHCAAQRQMRSPRRAWVLMAICVIAFTGTAVNAQAPLIYFSTEISFTATAGPHAGQLISDGDLLSTSGVVVARNGDLIRNFGPMPVVPDYGLDGVFVRPGGEILFSLEGGFWDEKLGTWVQHGDLLSDAGSIVKRNAQLLANFHPMPSPEPYDYGLDAIHPIGGGQVEFSIEETFWDEALGVWVKHGDLLSDSGAIIKSNAQLLTNFHPMPSPDPDYGLDAVHLAGGANIWFSIEETFWDELLGTWISQGDLLSTQGSIVRTNAQLLAAFFGGADSVPEDYGLDAAWVVPEPATLLLLSLGGLLCLGRRRKSRA